MIDKKIDKTLVEKYKFWFRQYAGQFKTGSQDYNDNIRLKEEHSFRVCREIRDVGIELKLNDSALNLAEISALFHDVGRFEQYQRFGTFLDFHSLNHAELGVDILEREKLFSEINTATADILKKAILYHNRAELPADADPQVLFYSRLLRDADKLDIWRVVTEYYGRADRKRNGLIELGLPDNPGVSSEACKDLEQCTIVKAAHVKNLNDFKLLQLGWIFDINFEPSFRRIKKRRYLEKIYDHLPKSDAVKHVYQIVQNYLKKNAR